MNHLIENNDMLTQLIIDETLCENTSITIQEDGISTTHYLTPKDLSNFIGILLHIQYKKQKYSNDFDQISNTF